MAPMGVEMRDIEIELIAALVEFPPVRP